VQERIWRQSQYEATVNKWFEEYSSQPISTVTIPLLLDKSYIGISEEGFKDLSFPSPPHGCFGFVGNYLLTLRKGCQQKSKFVLMGKTER